MINRINRFYGLGSLRFVFNKGTVIRGKHLSLRYQLNPRYKEFRAAVVVSRKTHKSAVVRNRIRRRIYEILRRSKSMISQPYDLVIHVYSDQTAEMPSQQLEKEILELLSRAKVTREQ